MVSRTAGHILGLFLQISKLRISFTSTCQKSWRFTPEFQQHKLIQPAPQERDFSETSKVTACRGVSNDFDICRLHRLKMKTLNCWNTFLFVCLFLKRAFRQTGRWWKKYWFPFMATSEGTSFHWVFSSASFVKAFQGISTEPWHCLMKMHVWYFTATQQNWLPECSGEERESAN